MATRCQLSEERAALLANQVEEATTIAEHVDRKFEKVRRVHVFCLLSVVPVLEKSSDPPIWP